MAEPRRRCLLMFGLVAQFRRTWSRRLLVVLASVVVLVGQIGVPVPVRVKKDKSRPFLCMHRACGCHSAEACWKSCCCHSKAERVAWAKRNRVEIPSEWGGVGGDATPTVAAHCDHENSSDATLCGSPKAIRERTSQGSCCSKGHGPSERTQSCDVAKAEKPSDDETDQHGWLSWEQFRQCRGVPNMWSADVDSLPPPAVVEVVARDVSGSYPVAAPVALVSNELDPPVPPPKIG